MNGLLKQSLEFRDGKSSLLCCPHKSVLNLILAFSHASFIRLFRYWFLFYDWQCYSPKSSLEQNGRNWGVEDWREWFRHLSPCYCVTKPNSYGASPGRGGKGKIRNQGVRRSCLRSHFFVERDEPFKWGSSRSLPLSEWAGAFHSLVRQRCGRKPDVQPRLLGKSFYHVHVLSFWRILISTQLLSVVLWTVR